jgi:S-adenosyl-L-methionine hydrolase (adenosine-forming)
MIVIFTDYGLQGPYLGQIDAVLAGLAPDQRVITLLADAPRYNPRACAYLLAAFTRDLPADTVFFAVVDPGVGSNLDSPVIMNADGHWYVGPDNGLFDMVARGSSKLKSWQINWRPERLSNTFHGRDLYAPVCAMIANKQATPGDLFEWTDRHQWPVDLLEIIYIDNFGNAMSGLRSNQLEPSSLVEVCGHSLKAAGKFNDVKPGQGFWFENSYGLVEIAINQGSASESLGIEISDQISIQ